MVVGEAWCLVKCGCVLSGTPSEVFLFLLRLELASPRLMSAAADQILKQITARTCGPQAGARGLQLLQSGGSGGSRPSESSDRPWPIQLEPLQRTATGTSGLADPRRCKA